MDLIGQQTDANGGSWHGTAALRDALVPLAQLHPHPRNPRRGVVPEIQLSLQRFGQQRPVLVQTDGTIVAGHHVVRAAEAEGWTHIAVTRTDLQNGEAEAYLLADNRLADLGLYDDALLAELLKPMAAADTLAGIGYSHEDVQSLLAYLDPGELVTADADTDPANRPYALGEADLFRIMLSFDKPTYEHVIRALDALMDEHGLDTYSDAVKWAVDAAR